MYQRGAHIETINVSIASVSPRTGDDYVDGIIVGLLLMITNRPLQGESNNETINAVVASPRTKVGDDNVDGDGDCDDDCAVGGDVDVVCDYDVDCGNNDADVHDGKKEEIAGRRIHH